MRYKNDVCKYLIFMLLICLIKFPCASSQCNDEEWECNNGECINEDYKCNGSVECKDGTDEIAENCIHLHRTCPKNAFKCLYGGCIAGVDRCNNKTNCADNSDELNCNKTDDPLLQGNCSEDEVQCLKSQECISIDNVCNGRKDCSDGSDEIAQVCASYGCVSTIGFQCGYGACIIEEAKCNGSIECADGSDEAWELCNYRRNNLNRGFSPPTVPPTRPSPLPTPTNPTQRKGCQIPNTEQTQLMLFKLHPLNDTVAVGTFVVNWETIHIECNNELGLRGLSTLLCFNGHWNDDFPICVKYCDGSLLQGLSTHAICDPNGKYHPCKKKIPPNTEIQINCKPGFITDNIPQRIRCLPDGTFDEERLPCSENCGRVASSAHALSINGIPTKPSKVPWNAAIYEYGLEYIYICSGSIVSPRVIISAAHCFYDRSNNVKKINLFQVIAGKSVKDYSTSSNENTQIADVAHIHIPFRYKGNINGFYNDIAFVILKTPLEYNENISSICIPDLRDYHIDGASYVDSGLHGIITGFGQTNELERLNMYTLSFLKCNETTPIATDKFCIYNNDGAFVCRGESGGGFVTERTDIFNQKVYKLLGVISNTPSTKDDCTREESKALVAVTSMYYLRTEFVKVLFNAINEDIAKY